jgi:hypothetical protein
MNKYEDGVDGIEQKMRVELGAEKLDFNACSRCRVCNQFFVSLMLIASVMLAAVEGSAPLSKSEK